MYANPFAKTVTNILAGTSQDGFIMKLKKIVDIKGGAIEQRSGSVNYTVRYVNKVHSPQKLTVFRYKFVFDAEDYATKNSGPKSDCSTTERNLFYYHKDKQERVCRFCKKMNAAFVCGNPLFFC